MKHTISTAILISGLMAALPAMASDNKVVDLHQAHGHQFLSKRPYVAPIAVASSDAEQGWVGATLVVGQDQKAQQLNVLKMQQIAKRPF